MRLHKWASRALVLLLIIDGVIPNAAPTTYFGIPALVVVLVYIPAIIWYEVKKRRE
jgi:hypothetical protein